LGVYGSSCDEKVVGVFVRFGRCTAYGTGNSAEDGEQHNNLTAISTITPFLWLGEIDIDFILIKLPIPS
jgi:hypothetical protein